MPTTRIYGLDIVRAFAILTVLFGHGLVLMPDALQKNLGVFGIDGVNIFFTLSGFLIGGILIRTLEKEGASFTGLLRFMGKRWLRTLPPYYLVLSFLTFWHLVLYSFPGFTLLDVRRYYLFIQNLNYPHPAFFAEAWSLAIEEWFYIIVPFFTYLSCRLVPPKKAILAIILLIILAVPIIRYLKSGEISTIQAFDLTLRKQVVTRLDSIVFGVLGAYISYYYPGFWQRWKTPSFVLGVVLYAFCHLTIAKQWFFNTFYFNVLSFSFTSLAVLLTFPVMSHIKQGSGLLYRFLTFTSLISYSLYLIHLTIVQGILLKGLQPGNWLLTYGLYWFLSFALAAILYRYFEKPVMRLRSKGLPKSLPVSVSK